jgi:hypothetical protein
MMAVRRQNFNQFFVDMKGGGRKEQALTLFSVEFATLSPTNSTSSRRVKCNRVMQRTLSHHASGCSVVVYGDMKLIWYQDLYYIIHILWPNNTLVSDAASYQAASYEEILYKLWV